MSKNIPQRILDSLLKIEKKIVTYPIDEKIKQFKDKLQDQKENRELVVVDKYGNKYYQYYSHQGIPSRRFVNLNMTGFNQWNDDVIMKAWLERRREISPTQEELEKMYIEHEEFQRRGLEWDRNEQKLIDEFRKKQKDALEKEQKETGAIGDGHTYQPGTWRREPQSETNSLTVVNESTELIEGASTIPGKYHMEMFDDLIKYHQEKYEKSLQPYRELEKKIVWRDYTLERMVQKYHEDRKKVKEEHKQEKQNLTNLGKKMVEKREQSSTYVEFRQRFKDVFEEFDFN